MTSVSLSLPEDDGHHHHCPPHHLVYPELHNMMTPTLSAAVVMISNTFITAIEIFSGSVRLDLGDFWKDVHHRSPQGETQDGSQNSGWANG